MTTVTLDPSLRGRLPDLSRPFTVCDESGNVVGRYMPASFGPPHSRSEIERRKLADEKTYSTSQVLSHLERS
jgi:hypothetical protein